MRCNFCQVPVEKGENMMSCDNECCDEVICMECADYALLLTDCCEQTYCRNCNINEYTYCDNCAVDICTLNCQKCCFFCDRGACPSCADSKWNYCNKCGIVCCDKCYDLTETKKCVACSLNKFQIQ